MLEVSLVLSSTNSLSENWKYRTSGYWQEEHYQETYEADLRALAKAILDNGQKPVFVVRGMCVVDLGGQSSGRRHLEQGLEVAVLFDLAREINRAKREAPDTADALASFK